MKLSEQAHQTAKQLHLLIEHHKSLTSTLENQLLALVKKDTGIDLDRENWDLELESGEMEQRKAE